jgi:hypothetical protein
MPDQDHGAMPPSHGRILVIMAVLGIVAALAAAIFGSGRFAIGLLLGTALAFGNYFWLKASLKRIFAEAAEGQKPKVSAIRYLSRYLAIGVLIAVIFVSDVVPIIAVILGLTAFGFATVVEGLIRIFSGIFRT